MWEFLLQLFLIQVKTQPTNAQQQTTIASVPYIDYHQQQAQAGGFESTFPLSPVKAEAQKLAPTKIDPLNLGVELSARSALLLDYETMTPLFSKNEDQVVSIASISKLLSALVILDLKPNFENTTVYDNTQPVLEGYRYIYKGERLKLKDLFYAGLVGSDNTSLVVLVDALGVTGDEFIALMNKKAKEIGMLNSSFVEITGLNANNVATANDIAMLLKYASEKTELTKILQHKDYYFRAVNTGIGRRVFNTNQLLNSFINVDPYKIIIGKTGHINESGYCLTSLVEQTNGGKVLAVILGSETNDDRFQDLKSMVMWGFNNYQWP